LSDGRLSMLLLAAGHGGPVLAALASAPMRAVLP